MRSHQKSKEIKQEEELREGETNPHGHVSLLVNANKTLNKAMIDKEHIHTHKTPQNTHTHKHI